MGKRRLKLEDWIMGFIATALAGIAIGVYMKMVWQAWEKFIEWVMATFNVGPEIEYVLGIILFVTACVLGLIQLKKFEIGKILRKILRR